MICTLLFCVCHQLFWNVMDLYSLEEEGNELFITQESNMDKSSGILGEEDDFASLC